jgi:hypothetical protein
MLDLDFLLAALHAGDVALVNPQRISNLIASEASLDTVPLESIRELLTLRVSRERTHRASACS